MGRLRLALALGLLAAIMLGACGSEQESAPRLAAIPTRTPVPLTATPEADVQPASVRVISLKDEIDAFLTASETASAVDRIDLFTQLVIQPAQECLTGTFYPGMEPLEMLGFNLTSIPMEPWREATDSFPEADLTARVTAALQEAMALLPSGHEVAVCLMPVPLFGSPEVVANSGVEVEALSGDRLMLTCAAGPVCLERARPEVAHGYGIAYQMERAGLTAFETPLLAYAIYSGRAEDLVVQMMPAATFRWSNALTLEQEIDVWARMQDYLDATYQDYPAGRNVDPFLVGEPDSSRYPRWAGLYIGSRIVRAYRERHPEVSVVDLAALSPKDLLADSGYMPGEVDGEET